MELHAELRRLFGHPRFLPGQREVVERALAGRDTLALMPTGSGKSLPYQLAAMLLPRPTLVVSPLIALMKDQVDKLPPPVAARAALVNSSLSQEQAAERLRAFAAGEVSMLYAAPERLRQRAFVSMLAGASVGLVVVDEVHCVSMWGHDFRPDYLFIAAALAELGEPPVLGLTATATPATEAEIGRSLGRDFEVVRASVVRPNLRHAVDPVENEEERRRRLLERLQASSGPAIVYARSRESCERLAQFLRGHRVSSLHYHAGMDTSERTAAQESFLSGRTRVVVATTAFGMGIDKPNIRLVLLYNLPGSLEDYVQMVGRAGRDGAPSDCVLFSGTQDARTLRRFVRTDVPSAAELRAVYRAARAAASGGVAVVEPDSLGDGRSDPRVLVGMLEQAGLVRRGFDRGRSMTVELLAPPPDAAERAAALLVRYERQAEARADRIIAFAESGRCRQQEIAEHFGERLDDLCGTCDACTRPAPSRSGVQVFAEDPSPALPEDVARAIVGAVRRLARPLGVTGLAATLTGSVSAPPTGRRSPSYGVLSAARPGTVKRWIERLVASGHLERFESEDGFPLLRLGPAREPPPRLLGETNGTEAAGPLFERLRAWRLERSRVEEVPAFVVFSDRTLHALAAAKPATADELADVPGIGSAKLDRYGADVLAVIGEFAS